MILVLAVVISILYLLYYANVKSMVRALANTWITLVSFIWMVTEILSAFKAWTRMTVFLCWLILLLILLCMAYKKRYVINWKEIWYTRLLFYEEEYIYRKALIGFLIYFIFVFIAGILSGQYNMDSMVYHLPRIMHWIQNGSVGHFAAGIDFQIRYPSLTEYLVAQVYLFGCSDRLANLIQTFAYLASSVMVFGISRKIGASEKASFTAAFVYLMIPMALVQAFSTQTDDVAGLFLLTFIFYILDFIQAEKLRMDRQGFISAIRLALNVMLGYLCKPTICFVMLIFFLWMCIVRIYKKDKFSILLKYSIIGVIIAVILYIPLFAKSYQTYTVVNKALAEEATAESGQETEVASSVDRALAPDVFNVKNALLEPSQFIITCIQNVARNSTSVCFPKYNESWEKLVTKTGGWLHKDTSSYRTQVGALFFYHDTASNPCVMILTLFMCITLIIRLSRMNRLQTVYIICAVMGFLAQCGLMGYTQYRTRYLVGAMAVLCPAIAVTVDRLKVKESHKNIVLAYIVFSAAIGGINTYSYELPRIKESFEGGDIHQYMLGNIEDEYVYRELIHIINENGYSKIGLDDGPYMEYPFWQGIENLERLENVNVDSEYFAQYEDMDYIPECIIRAVGDENVVEEGDVLNCHGRSYQCVWSIHWYQLYVCLYALI